MTKNNQLLRATIISLITFGCMQCMKSDAPVHIKTQDKTVTIVPYAHVRHMNILFTMFNKEQRSINSSSNPLQIPLTNYRNLKLVDQALQYMKDEKFDIFWNDLKSTDCSHDWKEYHPNQLSPLQKRLINTAEKLGAENLSILCLATTLPDILKNNSISALLNPITALLHKKFFTNSSFTVDRIFNHLNPSDYQVEGIKEDRPTFHGNILAITPDGNTIVTSAYYGEAHCRSTATVYDISNQNKLKCIPLTNVNQHITFPNTATITDDGKTIVIGTSSPDTEPVMVYDKTTNISKKIQRDSNIASMVINPTGETMVTSSVFRTRIYYMNKNQSSCVEHNLPLLSLTSISSDGKIIARAMKNYIEVLYLTDSDIKSKIILPNSDFIRSITMTSNGKTVAVAGEKGAKVYDLNDHKNPIHLNTHIVHSIAISDNGNIVVSGSDSNAVVYDISDRKKPVNFVLKNSPAINSVSISTDGTIVTIGYADWCAIADIYDKGKKTNDKYIEMFDISNPNNSIDIIPTLCANSIAVTPDGKTIVSIEGNKLVVHKTPASNEKQILKNNLFANRPILSKLLYSKKVNQTILEEFQNTSPDLKKMVATQPKAEEFPLPLLVTMRKMATSLLSGNY